MLISTPKCPDCSEQLSWQDLRGSFDCPNCSAHLKSNYHSVMFWTLVVLPFPFVLFVSLGGIATILIGSTVLTVISLWILTTCINVRRG